MTKGALALALLLSACGAVESERARNPYGALIGMTVPDLLSCAGKPDSVTQVAPDVLSVQWNYHQDATKLFSASIVILGSVDIGGGGRSCKMVATVLRDGTVADVAFPGRDGSLTTLPYAGCDVLVRECVDHPSDTDLPAGYDAFRYLLPAAKEG